jgi:hypothetical protein
MPSCFTFGDSGTNTVTDGPRTIRLGFSCAQPLNGIAKINAMLVITSEFTL